MISKRIPLKHIAAVIMLGCAAVSLQAADLKKEEVTTIARKVADWQIKEFPTNKYAVGEPKGWIAGALYMGMFDWAELSGDEQYFDWMKKYSTVNTGRWPTGCIMPTMFAYRRLISTCMVDIRKIKCYSLRWHASTG